MLGKKKTKLFILDLFLYLLFFGKGIMTCYMCVYEVVYHRVSHVDAQHVG